MLQPSTAGTKLPCRAWREGMVSGGWECHGWMGMTFITVLPPALQLPTHGTQQHPQPQGVRLPKGEEGRVGCCLLCS